MEKLLSVSRQVVTRIGQLGMVVMVGIRRTQSNKTVLVVISIVLHWETFARAMPSTEVVNKALAEVVNDEHAGSFSDRHNRIVCRGDDKEDIAY